VKTTGKVSLLEVSLLAVVFVLSAIGFGYLYSASQPTATRLWSSQNNLIIKQGIFFLAGFAALVFGMVFNHNNYKLIIKPLLFITFILLIATHLPGLGIEVKGAKSWLDFKLFRFQPSEFAKIVIVIYLSTVLAKKGDEIRDFYSGVFPPLLVVFTIAFIVYIENDFSGAFVIILISLIVFFLAGIRIVTLSLIGVTSIASIFFMVTAAQYRMRRLFAFLNPWEDPLGAGWQSIQSMKCFAVGKFWGVGLGNSSQTRNFLLPEAHNDYIFAVIAEEGGGVMAIIVLLLFFVLAIIGYNIAKKGKSQYSYLFAAGLTSLIFFQAMINIGVVLNVFPSTGVTLPFISAGGTSLILTMFITGVLINIGTSSELTDRYTGLNGDGV